MALRPQLLQGNMSDRLLYVHARSCRGSDSTVPCVVVSAWPMLLTLHSGAEAAARMMLNTTLIGGGCCMENCAPSTADFAHAQARLSGTAPSPVRGHLRSALGEVQALLGLRICRCCRCAGCGLCFHSRPGPGCQMLCVLQVVDEQLVASEH